MKSEIPNLKKTSKATEDVYLFGSVWQLSILASCNLWHIDGTFKVAPKGFEQLLIIVVTNPTTNLHTPVLYAFLTSKKESTYRKVLQNIKGELEKNQFKVDFSKVSIYCDFEKGLRNAITKDFDGTTVFGCFFHFVKALWYKAGKLGLKTQDCLPVTKQVILQLKLLAHLSKPLRNIYWHTILNAYKGKAKIEEFLNYFYNTWLKPDGDFPDAFDLSDEIGKDDYISRTNNISEGYNNRLQLKVKEKHPLPIWLLMFLKEEEKLFKDLTVAITTFKPGFVKRPVAMHYEDLNVDFPTLECMKKIKNFLKSKKITDKILDDLIKLEDTDILKLNDLEFENLAISTETSIFVSLDSLYF